MNKIQKTNKQLVICPVCETHGKIEVLGELVNDQVHILRFHNAYSIIQASSFNLICGNCGNSVLYRISKNK